MAVIMIYPDKRFVDTDPHGGGNPFFLGFLETFWTQNVPIRLTAKKFRKRVRLVNKLIDEYRQQGHKVYWAVFSEDKHPEIPDKTSIHWAYSPNTSDIIVPVGISYYEHTRKSIYPDEKRVLQQINLGNEAIFGGFHRNDCVMRFRNAAEKMGHRSRIDALLTEDWFFTAIESFRQDWFAYLIRTGRLDPEMHEDNPETEKSALFGERLTLEDLA